MVSFVFFAANFSCFHSPLKAAAAAAATAAINVVGFRNSRPMDSRNLGGEEPSASQVGGSFEILAALGRARGVAGEGAYMEETWHGKGKGGGGKGLVKSVRAGVRVGSGLGIFHKFAQGTYACG